MTQAGGAVLIVRVDPDRAAAALEILRDNRATSTNTSAPEPNADADEIGEADGWDDFSAHANEHSPDGSAESMWTDQNGETR
jgi:hypothetical protein